MTRRPARTYPGKLIAILIALICIGPLLVLGWMTYSVWGWSEFGHYDEEPPPAASAP